MSSSKPSRSFILLLGMILPLVFVAGSIDADEPQEHQDRITSFNVITGAPVVGSPWPYPVRPPAVAPEGPTNLSVGSVLSPTQGIGPGESVALTYDDAQYTVGQGRHIGSWWNGLSGAETQVDVHFGYVNMQEIQPGQFWSWSGHNIYAAENYGDWPAGQNMGFRLQTTDPQGWGSMPSLDVMNNGLVVTAATSAFWRNRGDGTRLVDNIIYYQGERWSGVYDPSVPLNVTWVDSTAYRDNFLNKSVGFYSRAPQVVTQWDGANTVIHLLLGEDSPGMNLTGSGYCDGIPYYTYTYFRKVGDNYTGTWSAGQTIDSLWFPWASMAAAPYPYQGVAVTYTNSTFCSGNRENPYDFDVWLRESMDRGISWTWSTSITDYDNCTEGDLNHFTAWLETQALYSNDGNLHVIWTAKPTSDNPYFDGFDWQSLDQNLYHWSKNTNQIVKVANGAFDPPGVDFICGNFSTSHCGFGGSNAGYIANINISECDGKLYCIWNQIHERANRYEWRCWMLDPLYPQPAPGVLDDCSYTDSRLARANWEILMSVARIETSALWDMPRNITNTYTPDCGLAGDPAADGLCGSEYKPSVERYSLNETGLDLYWPLDAIVDPTPEGGGQYTGTYYLNMLYLDDEFPGPSMWGEWQTQPRTLNEIKWIRLACVEPVEAAEIAVTPAQVRWPLWVRIGQSENFTISVVNEGNVTLNIVEIGKDGGSWLSTSENPTPVSPFVIPAGVPNSDSFDIIINAGGFSEPTWLDGLVWLRSDAANADSIAIPIHVLAAETVEPVVWDTVMTHQYMYDPYFAPVGTCVGLAVGNNGELGCGARSDGRANLDYTDATPGMPVGRRECDTTRADNRFYLKSATPFVIMADASDGTGAELTQVYMDQDQADETGFDPTPDMGSISSGFSAGGGYDSVYTGRFVNRDTTIAMERIVYAPRSDHPQTDILNFVVVHTKVYSANGQPHNHVTIGDVTDWNVPSDRPGNNTAGVAGRFVYVQGTDNVGHNGCVSNQGRFATEAYIVGYTSAEPSYNPCASSMPVYSQNIRAQSILVDTTNMRDGTPLVPPQPDPLLWWQTSAVPGINIEPVPDTGMDLCLFTTYSHDINLAVTDTLHYWTLLTTTPAGGTLTEFTDQIYYAIEWPFVVVMGLPAQCCQCRVGNVDGAGFYPDEITLGDVMLLVDVKFISGDCTKLTCIAEADVNQDGGSAPTCDENVTLGDIMILVDFLFITGPDNATLPACL